MRLAIAAVLGSLVPGIGHLITNGRRVAVLFLLPIVVLAVALLVGLLLGGPYGLVAFAVTPGVLPALAVLNVLLATWRIVASADAARRVEPTRRAAVLVAVVAVILVGAPHIVIGRAIASANDLLDSMFASAPVASPSPEGTVPPTSGPFRLLPVPTDVEIAPGYSLPPAEASLIPTPSPTPRRILTGDTSDPLPALGAAVPWQAPGAVPWGSDGRFDLLLMGSDAGSDRWSRRMDVMLLVEVDVATGQVAMVGMPRNLLNAPPGPAHDAIACGCLPLLLNEAYEEAVWNQPSLWPGDGAVAGIGAVRSIVSELTGRPIDAVLVADLIGVVRVVDALGGIDINVPYSVYDENYPDPVRGSIVLNIRAGQQHLDGRMALAYARSRHQDSDYGRMDRQQTLLLAIRQQLGPATILQAPDFVTAAKGAAWTDLPRDSLPNLVTLFGRAASAAVHQLRIVPPTYPEWLTPAVITRIRGDVAALLPPVPTPTPSPSAFPVPTTLPTGTPKPSGSPSAARSPTPTPSPIPPEPGAQLAHARRPEVAAAPAGRRRTGWRRTVFSFAGSARRGSPR